MTALILVRHSVCAASPDVPANTWHLTGEGRARCLDLATALVPYAPQVIITSSEPKAIETGQILGDQLGLKAIQRPGLHEHERESLSWFDQQTDFEAAVRALFEQPEQLVLGEETAVQAQARFSHALDACQNEYPDRTIAVVTHGTVMSLLVAEKTGRDAYRFWSTLGMPSFVVFRRPDFALLAAVSQINEP